MNFLKLLSVLLTCALSYAKHVPPFFFSRIADSLCEPRRRFPIQMNGTRNEIDQKMSCEHTHKWQVPSFEAPTGHRYEGAEVEWRWTYVTTSRFNGWHPWDFKGSSRHTFANDESNDPTAEAIHSGTSVTSAGMAARHQWMQIFGSIVRYIVWG